MFGQLNDQNGCLLLIPWRQGGQLNSLIEKLALYEIAGVSRFNLTKCVKMATKYTKYEFSFTDTPNKDESKDSDKNEEDAKNDEEKENESENDQQNAKKRECQFLQIHEYPRHPKTYS